MGDRDNHHLPPSYGDTTIETIETEGANCEVTNLRMRGEGFSAANSVSIEADVKILPLDVTTNERRPDLVPQDVQLADDGVVIVTLVTEMLRELQEEIGWDGDKSSVETTVTTPPTKANGSGRVAETDPGTDRIPPKNTVSSDDSDVVERDAPSQTDVILRTEEVKCVVEVLDWYGENDGSKELEDRCHDVLEMLQPVVEVIENPTARNPVSLKRTEAELIREAIKKYRERDIPPRKQSLCHEIKTKLRETS